MEAGTGEIGDGSAVAPIESEEAAGLSGCGAGDGGSLDDGDGDASVALGRKEVGGADADNAAAADYYAARMERVGSAGGGGGVGRHGGDGRSYGEAKSGEGTEWRLHLRLGLLISRFGSKSAQN